MLEYFGLEKFFGRPFDELFNEVFGELTNEEKDEEDVNHSYFHSIKDKYEDGEHVYHQEKEVKDGKVLKDEKKTFALDDKGCKCCKSVEVKDGNEQKKCDSTVDEDNFFVKEINKLKDEKRKNDKLEEENDNYRIKLHRIEEAFK